MFILTDPTMVSINHIQQAHKKADKNFYDIVSELYDIEFIKQEILKEDRIKEAKEEALETERIERQKREQIAREQQALELRERERQEQLQRDSDNSNDETMETSGNVEKEAESTTSTTIGNDWSQVSPEQASQYMSARTGVSVSTWQAIIYAESTNNPTVTNSIGCFGYLQLHPIHGNVSGMSPQQYLDTAVGVYNSQGLTAWEVVTNGSVQ